MPATKAIAWARRAFHLRAVTSDELLYEHMESQSMFSLPVIYRPFELHRRSHWHDRGAIVDFAVATGPGHILDLGPGDGWPSIPMAAFCTRVTGADASLRRIQTCRANARRLGCSNVSFVHIIPGEPLPFPDATFDGVVAATSVEQTPDPLATLRELRRVLKPGGRLRMTYETLDPYRGGREHDAWLASMGDGRSQLVLYERHPHTERAVHVALRLKVPLDQVRELLGLAGDPAPQDLTDGALERLRPLVFDAVTCTLIHPSCRTWLRWLHEAGFASARPTHWVASLAAELFDRLEPDARPRSLQELDRLLISIARRVKAEALTHDEVEGEDDAIPLARELLARPVSSSDAPPILAC